jgi:hypothetical protein
MGRRRKPLPHIGIELSLPLDVVSWLNQRFYDPRIGKPTVGARALLIERLLREEMRREDIREPHDAIPR